ncbi:MAG: hypothetical protein A2157_07635 [Deltaproteobacteria bacterium RBG_16_47_11]|nr:MAG: hypothetical protein A2157_07635 [Deltaproteobacteria bacterium RBG_16_47_11]
MTRDQPQAAFHARPWGDSAWADRTGQTSIARILSIIIRREPLVFLSSILAPYGQSFPVLGIIEGRKGLQPTEKLRNFRPHGRKGHPGSLTFMCED